MSDGKPREGWQMEGSSSQRRWHYIEGNTSLCGRFGFYFGEVGPPLQPGNSGSDCAECIRRVARRIELAEPGDLSPIVFDPPLTDAEAEAFVAALPSSGEAERARVFEEMRVIDNQIEAGNG